jgi:uncharacterized protein (UPF0276 family)
MMEADVLSGLQAGASVGSGSAAWQSLSVAINADSVASWFLPGVAPLLQRHRLLLDIVIDDHGSCVSEPVWAVYTHAVACWGPVPSLIEWDTNVPAWDVLVQQARHADLLDSQALAARTACHPMPAHSSSAHAHVHA